jgi:Voltage-dependent anion channel
MLADGYSLALWFFLVSVGAHYTCVRGKMLFAMNWFSFIFPNTALTTATFAIANAFNSPAIAIVGCVMTCLLMMFRAVYLRQILWPQKGEDKDEGGFKAKDIESLSTASGPPEPQSHVPRDIPV